jgi:hypothetical protein
MKLDVLLSFWLSSFQSKPISKKNDEASKYPPLFFFFSSIPNLSVQRLEGLPPLINLGRSSPVVAAGGLVLVPVVVVDDAVVLL